MQKLQISLQPGTARWNEILELLVEVTTIGVRKWLEVFFIGLQQKLYIVWILCINQSLSERQVSQAIHFLFSTFIF